ADEQYCFPIPDNYPYTQAAPLLFAGLIVYRNLRKADRSQKLGFYGFGSAAHILTQVAHYTVCQVFAITRSGYTPVQLFPRQMGAVWAGVSEEQPPEKLDAAIIFAPVGPLVPRSLRSLKKGGSVICAGIHMSDIPSFPYHI